MRNVLMEYEDGFVCLGLKFVLERVFKEEVIIIQTKNFIQKEGGIFDCYFFSNDSGDESICHPQFLRIPENKPIFLIAKRELSINFFNGNKCLEGCDIISIEMSIKEIEEILSRNINLRRKKIHCHGCSRPSLTTKEATILDLYLSGCGIVECSSFLNIPEKSVYAYIDRIKRKLGVRGNKELHFLVNKLKNRTSEMLYKK